MKTILCYGDSNTWGYVAGSAERYAPDVRWPGVMRAALGSGYAVIEEGLNGRTTVFDDPIEDHRNGETYLRPCLETHAPVDLVILMLGTNDLKARFSLSAFDIAAGIDKLAGIVCKSGVGPGGGAPAVLIAAPAPVKKLTDLKEMFAGAEEKSMQLARHFRAVAAQLGCGFFDVGSVAQTDGKDGIHLTEEAHTALGHALAGAVRTMV